MGLLKIYTFPDPVLAKRAESVARVDRTFYKLAEDMLETMYDAPGIGLAANQVGVLQRILVLDVDGSERDEGDAIATERKRDPLVILNPVITEREGEIIYCEGCLSVPEFTADVRRSEKIKLRYQNLDGLEQTLSAEGLLAIAIQHEIDHLDGRLFIDRLSAAKRNLVRKRLLHEDAPISVKDITSESMKNQRPTRKI